MPARTFLYQLYSILHQPGLSDLVYWSKDDPTVFILKPYHQDFAQKILKSFFKHGNVSSFVRQLHMYGFHKLSQANSAVPASANGIANSENIGDVQYLPSLPQNRSLTAWYFTHPSGYFRRGTDLSNLEKIQRKSANLSKDAKRKISSSNLPSLNANGTTTMSTALPFSPQTFVQSSMAYSLQNSAKNPSALHLASSAGGIGSNTNYVDATYQQPFTLRNPFKTSPIPTPPPTAQSFLILPHVRAQQQQEMQQRQQQQQQQQQQTVYPMHDNGGIQSYMISGALKPQPLSANGLPQTTTNSLVNSTLTQSKTIPLTHPTPSRTPVIVATSQPSLPSSTSTSLNVSKINTSSSTAELNKTITMEQHSILDKKLDTINDSLLQLTQIVQLLAQSNTDNKDYLTIDSTLQAIKNDLTQQKTCCRNS